MRLGDAPHLLHKAVRQPRRAMRYAWQRLQAPLVWDARFARLREPKVRGPIVHEPRAQEEVARALVAAGFEVRDLAVDPAEFRAYLEAARYERYPGYYGGGRLGDFREKALEHFLAAKLLDLGPDDVYVDVASYDSPVPDLYRRLYGCRAYRQDLVYPAGLRGDTIGGDAGHMPVADGFATAMGLHNAFEHFEGDSDTAFVVEAARVLRPGGRMCIVPLFLHTHYAIQTDPGVLPAGGLAFERDAVLHCERGDRNRHGRFYDVPHLDIRIRAHMRPLRLTILRILNEKEIDPVCYAKFVGLFEKPAPVLSNGGPAGGKEGA